LTEPKARKQDDGIHQASGLPVSAIADQARRIAGSACFRKARRLTRFLEYAVENALAGREDALKETVLGIEVFDRGQDFDPRSDPIVRIDARRLRARLAEYYESEGVAAPIVIEFELGSYVPRFRRAGQNTEPLKPGFARAPKGLKALLTINQFAKARQQLDTLTPGGILKSVSLFERIIAANPEHPLAHTGLATASMIMAMFFYEPSATAMPRARASVERALEIDPACAEAHAALGAVKALHDFDFPAANASFLMASRLKPGSASILHARAAFYLTPLGFLDEAAEDVRKALQRDSRSLLCQHTLGWIQYLRRDYAAAAATAERILKANKELIPAVYLRALACERLGRWAFAASEFSSDAFSAHPLAHLRSEALRLAGERNREAASRIARKMEAMYQPGILSALALAEVFVAIDDFDRAFDWLEAAYRDRRHRLIYLKSDPAWDPIRAQARFGILVTKMGLAERFRHA
jgi:tetratricopeptide (TPR) repeat protein